MSSQEQCGAMSSESRSSTDVDSSTSIPYDDTLLDGNFISLIAVLYINHSSWAIVIMTAMYGNG